MALPRPSGPETEDETSPLTESTAAKTERTSESHPEYLTSGQTAKLMGITKNALRRYYQHKLPNIVVDGIRLYQANVVAAAAAARIKKPDTTSRLAVKGIEVERLQQICVDYYRRHIATNDYPELLRLAKRIAKL